MRILRGYKALEEKAALFSVRTTRTWRRSCHPDQCFIAYWYYSQQTGIVTVSALTVSKTMLRGCQKCSFLKKSFNFYIKKKAWYLLFCFRKMLTFPLMRSDCGWLQNKHTIMPLTQTFKRARIFTGKTVSSHTFIPIMCWQNRRLYCWDNDVIHQPVTFIFSKRVTLGSPAEAVTSAWLLVKGTMSALSREQNHYLSLYADKIHTGALYGSENGCWIH